MVSIKALPCMQDTFARATHSVGRPSAARDDRVSCIQNVAICCQTWSVVAKHGQS